MGRKKKTKTKKQTVERDLRADTGSAHANGSKRVEVAEARSAPTRLRDNIDYIFAGFASLAFFFSVMTTGDCFVGSGTDMVSNEYPLHAFAFSWMRRGVLPLWNPFVFNGAPFQAGVHGFLYPGWWTGLVLPTCFDIKLGILLHLALAATGGVWLARSYVKNRISSLACGIIFALSGFFAMHCFAGHRVMIATAAYLPWIGGALERALRGSIKNLLFGAAMTGLMLLAGHYHVVYIGMSGLALFLLVQETMTAGSAKAALKSAAKAVLFWTIVFAGGALISAVQLAPMLGTIELSQRTGGSVEFSASFSSAPVNLISYLLPNLFGNKVDAPFIGDWSYWESLGYLGITPLCLILMGLAGPVWRRMVPSAAVALVGIVLALGAHTPIFDLYYAVVPGADLFRSPGRFCLLATLFLSLASAQSIDAFLEGEVHPKISKTAWISLFAVPASSLAAVIVIYAAGPDGLKEWLSEITDPKRVSSLGSNAWAAFFSLAKSDGARALLFSSATAAAVAVGFKFPDWSRRLAFAIVALLFLDLHTFGVRFMKTAPKESFELPAGIAETIKRESGIGARFLAPPDTRWHDYGSIWEIGNPGGYDSFIDGRYARYVNYSQGKKLDRFFGYERLRRGSRLIRNLGPTFLLSRTPMRNGRSRDLVGYEWFEEYKKIDGVYLYRDKNAPPRAAIVHEVEVVEDEEAAYREMSGPEFDIRNKALLEAAPVNGSFNPEQKPSGAVESAQITLLAPNRVEIAVKAASRAVLVLSDTMHPGWSASIGKEEVPMVSANRVMRAVPVPAGASEVVMTYRPASFVLGAVVTVLSVFGLAVAAFLMRRRWT